MLAAALMVLIFLLKQFQLIALLLHDMTCGKYGAYVLHWGFGVTTFLSIVFTFTVLPETSGKSLEEIETFFTHLRREAMDMVGDRAACRYVPHFYLLQKKARH